ncbi:helix-turn-helix transcriptional regulator [Pirellulaceae bacterium SH449]
MMEIFRSQSTPKVFVLASSIDAQEKISRALGTEPVQIINLPQQAKYFDLIDDIEAACVLVEISTNSNDELDLLTALQSRVKSLPIIAVGEQWSVNDAVRVIKSGADDVCDLHAQLDSLSKLVHKAMASGAPRKGELQNVIPPNILERLDTEEARIVHLITLGLTAKEIGSALDVSIRTYHYRKKTIFEKLNISNRSELIELIRTSRIRIVSWHNAHSGPQSPMIVGPATATTRFAPEMITSAINDDGVE